MVYSVAMENFQKFITFLFFFVIVTRIHTLLSSSFEDQCFEILRTFIINIFDIMKSSISSNYNYLLITHIFRYFIFY